MLRCALLAVYCTALATAQFAKEMQVETVIKLKESYTTDRALPTYFSGEENLPTEITQKIFSSIEAKAKNVLIELIPDFDVRWFNLINFELTEHHNPMREDLLNLAKVNFEVRYGDIVNNEFIDTSIEFSKKLSNIDISDDENEVFMFLPGATTTDQMDFNPCNSPFLNDCDPQSQCEGIAYNQWSNKINSNIFPTSDFNQHAAFFTCSCNQGYINQRTYSQNQSSIWFLKGSVCMENKFKDDKIFEESLKGGIAMAVFLFIVIVTMFVICVRTRDRRTTICCGKKRNI